MLFLMVKLRNWPKVMLRFSFLLFLYSTFLRYLGFFLDSGGALDTFGKWNTDVQSLYSTMDKIAQCVFHICEMIVRVLCHDCFMLVVCLCIAVLWLSAYSRRTHGFLSKNVTILFTLRQNWEERCTVWILWKSEVYRTMSIVKICALQLVHGNTFLLTFVGFP